jgi:hypothetical protein
MITTDHFQNDGGEYLGAFQGLAAEFHVDNTEKPLAKGVLRQAAKDLRLFQGAQDRVGRALYTDAYTWVLSDDTSWPYSFVNVCQLLGVSIEFTRTDLLFDAQSQWYSRSLRTAKRISTSIRDGLATAFGSRTVSEEPEGSVSSANSSTTGPVLAT